MEEIWINSNITGKKHRIRVWIPCEVSSNQKFPVIYMMDGQNVFFNNESFSGCSWRVLEYMNSLDIMNRSIIVAIDNGEARYDEYSPWLCEKRKTNFENRPYGGEGDSYSKFIVNEVKTFIDSHYPVKMGKENTTIIGSSMGGFITAYTAFKYSDIFGNAGIFSIASWFAETQFLDFVKKVDIDPALKIFIYVGGNESSDEGIIHMNKWYIQNSENLYNAVIQKGHDKRNIKFMYNEYGQHTERCWAEAIPDCLNYFQQQNTAYN